MCDNDQNPGTSRAAYSDHKTQEGPLDGGPSAKNYSKNDLLSMRDLSADSFTASAVGIDPQRTQEDTSTIDTASQGRSEGARHPRGYNAESIASHLTWPRLSKYTLRAPRNLELAIALYEWDCNVSAALHFPLRQLEICLRNSISRALADKYGEAWMTNAKFFGCTPEIGGLVSKIKADVQELKNGATYNTDDFVARATFHFWRELCKPSYIVHFWSKRIKIAFPNIPYKNNKEDGLIELHKRVDLILKLRNRIAHHEPLIGGKSEKIGEKIKERHGDMMTLFQWIDDDIYEWIKYHDFFELIFDRCPIDLTA